MGKPFNAGLAASNAVEASLLVQHGLRPNQDGLEGGQGFGETHHGQGQLEDALNGLGDTWLFETISHKFHACCHGLHATLEAFRPMQGRQTEIATISVTTNPRWLRVCNILNPRDGLECKFSYRHVLAMAAFGQDTASIDAYTKASASDELLNKFRKRVVVNGDDAVLETAIRLTVVLHRGEKQEFLHDLDAPIDFADRKARILAKSASLIGQVRADQLMKLVFSQADPETLGLFLSNKYRRPDEPLYRRLSVLAYDIMSYARSPCALRSRPLYSVSSSTRSGVINPTTLISTTVTTTVNTPTITNEPS
jgi:hypothetical protein